MSNFIVTNVRGKLLIVKLNRPAKRNALTGAMYCELTRILQQAKNDDGISIVALTGTDGFYSSGNDFMDSLTPGSDGDKNIADLKDFIDEMILFPKLLVAVVNGPAIGIACTTVTLCDIVYAAEGAYFLTPFARLALCPEGCSSYTFPKILGTSKASEMLFFGEKLKAQDALPLGFISKIYKPSEVGKIWAHLETASNAPLGFVKRVKRMMRKEEITILLKANAMEMSELKDATQSEDFLNSVSKFFKSKM